MTLDERAANIVQDYMNLTAIVRRQVYQDLLRIVAHLPDLTPLVAAAERIAQAAEIDSGTSGAA